MCDEQINECINEIELTLKSIAARNNVSVDGLFQEICGYMVAKSLPLPVLADGPESDLVIPENLVWNHGVKFPSHDSIRCSCIRSVKK